MKIGRLLIAGTVLAMSSVTVAHAGTRIMATAPAERTYPSDHEIDCALLNLHRVDRTVNVEIMDYFGGIVSTSGPHLVPASQGTSWGTTSGAGAWCRFTVEGSTKKYRVAAIYSQGATYTASVPGK